MPDLSGPPPSRYRVVERGRRLEVVDRATGRPATRHDRAAPGEVDTGGLLPRQTKFDGSAVLTTRAFYDDKAPRSVRLGAGTAELVNHGRLAVVVFLFALLFVAIVNAWLLLPLAFVLGNGQLRAVVRRGITRRIDQIELESR